MPKDPVPELLRLATNHLEAEFADLPDYGPKPDTESGLESEPDFDAMARVLDATARRLGDNYPYFHPLYAGQMLKPPHPVARAAYALAMKINPNNHSRDRGRARSEVEIEAVQEIAAMLGWKPGEFLGHLTSSGTLANLEALWVAGQLAPGERILGSAQAHYTHHRISGVLKLRYTAIPTDRRGRMLVDAVEAEAARGDVGLVVVTLGTTGIGAVDQLDEILKLKDKFGF